jgi:hypothetical protein
LCLSLTQILPGPSSGKANKEIGVCTAGLQGFVSFLEIVFEDRTQLILKIIETFEYTQVELGAFTGKTKANKHSL